jgi:hypothetical protein
MIVRGMADIFQSVIPLTIIPLTMSGLRGLGRTQESRVENNFCAGESGVALPPALRFGAAGRLPPQSKTTWKN